MALNIRIKELKRSINEALDSREALHSGQMYLNDVDDVLVSRGFKRVGDNDTSIRYVNVDHQIDVNVVTVSSDKNVAKSLQCAPRSNKSIRTFANVSVGLDYIKRMLIGQSFVHEGQVLIYEPFGMVHLQMAGTDDQIITLVNREFVKTVEGLTLFPGDLITILEPRNEVVWIELNGELGRLYKQSVNRTHFDPVSTSRQNINRAPTSTIKMTFYASDVIDSQTMMKTLTNEIDSIANSHAANVLDVKRGFDGMDDDHSYGRVNVRFNLVIKRSFDVIEFMKEILYFAQRLDHTSRDSRLNVIAQFEK